MIAHTHSSMSCVFQAEQEAVSIDIIVNGYP